MSIPLLTLQTDKNTTSVDVDRITIRQSESGLVLKANLVDSTGSAYDLTNCKVSFGENKNGGKMVDDDNIEIINAKSGQISYKLNTAVYQESGSAWFEIEDDANKLIDTTTNFFIEVLKQAELPTENENYWSKADLMLTHIEAFLQKAQNDILQNEKDNNNKIVALTNDFQNKLESCKSELSAYGDKFNQLSTDWATELAAIKKDASDNQESIKATADKQIADSQKAFDNAKTTTIDTAKKDFAQKLTSIQSDYDSWKQSTINDFKTKLDKLESELKTDEDAQTKLQAAIDAANVAIGKINDVDFTKFAHLDDLKKYYTKDEIKSLDPLNSADGNNIYDSTINLDTYSVVGMTKFLNCKLQSSGKMAGFDQATDKLYGWIFNVPKWNGASELQQIVYILDYGQGTLSYVRSHADTNKEDFEKNLTDKDLQQAIDSFGQTKSVNGVKPDSTGNIAIKIPSDYVKSVNSQTPDSNGNVNVDTGGVRTINGKNGDVTMATFASNLLKGTSDQSQAIPSNTATDIVHLTTDGNAKYTVAVDIDYSSFPSGTAGATLQVNNGGTVVESARVTAGSKGRVSVTFTTPADCYWVTILLSSNSSYTGKYSCLKASHWQDLDTPPDMTWLPNASDNSTAIKDLQNKISSNTNSYLKTWVGTLTQYQAMTTHEPMTAYVIISDYKVVIK